MQKTLVMTTLTSLLLTAGAQAALPPYHQAVREMTAVLENEQLATNLGSQRAIDSITRTENGYRVRARGCVADVEVEYLPVEPGYAGPVEFELRVGMARCRR